MRRAGMAFILLPLLAAAAPLPVPPRAERGRAGADCRPGEPGPAVRVDIGGFKDRRGMLVLELYPANDEDFLAADKALIAAGKVFRRVSARPPATGNAQMCVRAPSPGRYAVFVLHDRDGNGRFGFLRDGVGFANNPRIGASKPRAAQASIAIGPGVETIAITLNYRRGLGFGPLDDTE